MKSQSVGHDVLTRFVVTTTVLFALSVGAPEDEGAPAQPIRMDAIFFVMSGEIIDKTCNAREFQACFDVPLSECSYELRNMIGDCREDMQESLPEYMLVEDADPIFEEVFACVVPKWDALIKNRRSDTEECRRLEQAAKKDASKQ